MHDATGRSAESWQLSFDGESSRLGEALEAYLRRVEEGHSPDIDAFVSSYPEIAGDLRAGIAKLDAIGRVAAWLEPAEDADGIEFSQSFPARLGDYRIIGEIGRGGMGVVYEAEQLSLARRVALKILPLSALFDARRITRFKNEAAAAASLDHPHIVAVYGVGCDGGIHHYAMQLVHGCSLADVIAERVGGRAAKPDGDACVADTVRAALDSTLATATGADFHRRIAEIGRQVADALHHAHQRGVVHRDVKPSNLLIDADGVVLVADFGLAATHREAALTRTGELLGTLRYMCPEQAERSGVVDHRADVYSLGATLFELLAGHPVVRAAGHADALRELLYETPPALTRLDADIPADLSTVVEKAIARRPADRYDTAADLANDLQRFLDDKPVVARRPTLWRQAASWARRNRLVCTLLSLVIGLLATVAIGAFAYAWRVSAAREAEQSAKRLAEEQAATSAVTVAALQELITPKARYDHRGVDYTVLQLLEDFEPSIDHRFAAHPLVEAKLRKTFARTYKVLGRRSESQRQIRLALRLHQEHLAPLAPERIDTMYWAGRLLPSREAIGVLQDRLALLESVGAANAEIARTYESLSSDLAVMERYAECESACRKAIALDPGANVRGRLTKALVGVGRADEAATSLLAKLRRVEASQPHSKDHIAWIRRDLARSERALGNAGEALKNLAPVIALVRRQGQAKIDVQLSLCDLLASHHDYRGALNELAITIRHLEERSSFKEETGDNMYCPDLAEAYTYSAICRERIGQVSQAERDRTRAGELLGNIFEDGSVTDVMTYGYPHHYWAWVDLAGIPIRGGERTRASTFDPETARPVAVRNWHAATARRLQSEGDFSDAAASWLASYHAETRHLRCCLIAERALLGAMECFAAAGKFRDGAATVEKAMAADECPWLAVTHAFAKARLAELWIEHDPTDTAPADRLARAALDVLVDEPLVPEAEKRRVADLIGASPRHAD